MEGVVPSSASDLTFCKTIVKPVTTYLTNLTHRAKMPAFEHLALSINLGRGIESPESCWWAMLTAYFDDSGKHGNTSAVVISGFVSTLEQWLEFDRNWRSLLALPEFDLEYFHMKELRQGKGRFAKFKDDMSLQADLFRRFLLLIKIRILRPFAGIVLTKDYDVVNAEYELDLIGPPGVVAAMMAIGRLMQWKNERNPNDDINIVLDQGMAHFGAIDNEIYRRYGFRVIPAVVAKTPPLQACDFIAWEQHRAASQRAKGPVQDWDEYRGSFLAILDKLGTSEKHGGPSWYFWGEDGMRNVCETFGIARRSVASEQK